MRYIGNKSKLLDFIEGVIDKYKIKGNSFVDLFSGTSSVGDFFKDKYKIISNDFMYYSYVFSKAKLLNDSIPKFKSFNKKYSKDVFEWLNEKEFKPNKHFFVYNNYTPKGERMFFTEANGLKIDGIRISIEDLYCDRTINENEYYFLLASLLESVTKVSNTSGTYEAFFKFWDTRAEKEFCIKPLEFLHKKYDSENLIYNQDSNELLRKIDGDILYIDPPYSVTQYASAYHILETIARYDFPYIKGVGGKRDKGKCVSLYSRKHQAYEQFEDLFRQANFEHILISYSNQSIISLDELVDLAKRFSVKSEVYVEDLSYREYQNHRSSNKRNGKKLKEVIIYFKKDTNVIKSPLNYSGSKDKLVPQIIKELPKHIDTFVDVMGGAFNVGVNIVATNKVIYNEINSWVFDLVNWLLKNNKKPIIKDIENTISFFKLEKGAKEEYLRLRDEYNDMDSKTLYLYVLHMYSFQNMIRFNNSKKFNTPIGVAGYSDDIKNRILNFKAKSKVILTNKCYTIFDWESFPQDTVFYFDPPYFITSASYNDGKRGLKGWDGDSEVEMLSNLTKLDSLGYKFILSNVLHHRNKTNHLLIEWIQEHNFKVIDVGTTGWRYAKNEVLIKNF
ncbi:Dam family site-specific DNA-(adenine-N6)-methyltransferase [Aequorivita todarodis]|uniref:Dam family site-specific DNA-(adenine-N6)-methyltransferase n=1 Tax=Aequorivita todarodis TaxID=2036821 RepID=UPI0023504DA1|nr:Dam family site-specific DNA-(adenine-N6)-methyltransferase [Aequorivita todarodis]MDC8001527.1 Dam family site-specific DNA-(adenine-N6)-methyltransferase [Aequorivita todarodis]